MDAPPYLRAVDLRRHYHTGPQNVRALDGIDLDIGRGEFLGIVGSSGSGKSTILNLLAGLDTPTSGSIELEGRPFSQMTRRELAAYRAHSMGMIFQSFNLISHYTALQNVETALYFNDTPANERRALAEKALAGLGLADRLMHKPADLSGGEQQRVAVARAIVKKPRILFADEPTGNLDYENSEQIAALLSQLNREGLTILMVTHNRELAERCAHRTIRMHYGRIAGTAAGEQRSAFP
jgi:putative ABC transport system ATP-binding protein